ncbi:hypothetical protein [Rhodobacter capsulatus]|uniref:Phage conserved domain protein n=1 Tax=Rhodobacter capsulatus (strain ATCC BAA-309 / NBRC 16581 / SB1003) TaxID=272942 RepID=D5APR4_RHOCB|nr:hypothetical protein [Rhodobacter capsulatus]ADE86633.1 phage conserved domain protein [Rhodobacter capsulatus SB 1003]ETD00521.1 hypothetical protein U714_15965 [Rhodobacter capsulatus DE442]ETD74861.1 hypothetical protein U717_15930 [Rhodobacter capsulatus R121]ETE52601.1 hypothetical protein U715_15920 [Rhodobacter capsulatus Y262]MDS0928434.1 hypothetical protein [Rhodobacter capsulatus]
MATPLPSTATLTTPPSSHAAMRTNLANLRSYLAGLLGADGETATALATLGAVLARYRTEAAATTVAVTDRGTFFSCTGIWALTLPSAAAAGAGWCIVVAASGGASITLTPAGSDLIAGLAAYDITAQRAVIVICTGTGWRILRFLPQTLAAKTILGNNAAAGGEAKELTAADVLAMLPVVTALGAGLAPATGGVAGAFLRSDGTWTADNLVLMDATQTIAGTKRFSASGAFVLQPRAADPASPESGQIWQDGTHLKAYISGAVRVLDGQADIPMLVPPAGQYVMTTLGAGGTALEVAAGIANSIDLYPYVPRADLAVAALAVNCVTAVAGAQGKFVVYWSDANGQPAALAVESGTVDLSSTGVKEAVMTGLNMRAGATYWVGFRHSSTASISRWPVTATPCINGGAPSTAARKILRRTRTFGTAAATTWGFNAAEINAASAPAIWLKL